ncbi:transposase [Bradyrhizobium sp. USDA 4541]|nr:transposase [Bradyrhizobium sp. USDA 4541]
MTWTEITRVQHDRGKLRYASYCTDAEWALIELLMPEPSKVGRPRKTCLRSVWDAIQYIATTGCQWALLPKDFPPFTTGQYYFYGRRDSGALRRSDKDREAKQRERSCGECCGEKTEQCAERIEYSASPSLDRRHRDGLKGCL